MCASTFAEADAFDQLMAHQANVTTPSEELRKPQFWPHQAPQLEVHLAGPEKNPFFAQDMDLSTRYEMQPPHNPFHHYSFTTCHTYASGLYVQSTITTIAHAPGLCSSSICDIL